MNIVDNRYLDNAARYERPRVGAFLCCIFYVALDSTKEYI